MNILLIIIYRFVSCYKYCLLYVVLYENVVLDINILFIVLLF